METIAERIKRIRTDKGLSLRDVALQSGIPVSTYRDWENGRSIKAEAYEKMARVLNISLNELLTGKRPNPREILIKVHEIESACKVIRESLKAFEE